MLSGPSADFVGVELARQVQQGVHRVEAFDVARLVRDPCHLDAPGDGEQRPRARPPEGTYDAVGSLRANRPLRDRAKVVVPCNIRRTNSVPRVRRTAQLAVRRSERGAGSGTSPSPPRSPSLVRTPPASTSRPCYLPS